MITAKVPDPAVPPYSRVWIINESMALSTQPTASLPTRCGGATRAGERAKRTSAKMTPVLAPHITDV
jgi:hypothetical protein